MSTSANGPPRLPGPAPARLRSALTAGRGPLGLIGCSRRRNSRRARSTGSSIRRPAGSIDTTARIIQPYLEKAGIKTTLEYVLGAGGRVARTKLLTARPDGYAMMTESAPGGAIDEVIGRANYKASEFIPIYGWSVISWQLCVKKDLPIRTFQGSG